MVDEPATANPVVKDSLSVTPSSNHSSTDPPAPELPPKPVREMARVLFPYTALQADELDLREGDLIIIHSKDCEDKGWWKGEFNNKVSLLKKLQIFKICFMSINLFSFLLDWGFSR